MERWGDKRCRTFDLQTETRCSSPIFTSTNVIEQAQQQQTKATIVRTKTTRLSPVNYPLSPKLHTSDIDQVLLQLPDSGLRVDTQRVKLSPHIEHSDCYSAVLFSVASLSVACWLCLVSAFSS